MHEREFAARGSGTENADEEVAHKTFNSFILQHGTGREGNEFGVSAVIVTGSSNTYYITTKGGYFTAASIVSD